MNNSNTSGKAKPKYNRQLGVIPEHGFMRIDQVLSVIPESKTNFYEGIKTGCRPAPVKLSARSSAWRCEDIRKLIEALGGAEQ